MSATEASAGDFGSMTNNSAAAVPADWSKGLYCTLEAVKNMTRFSGDYFKALVIVVFKALVIVVPTDFTLGH
jgi:hypothetical protein